MESEERWDEGGENRRRADIADDRNALAQFSAGETAHREQYDRHQDVGRNGAGGGKTADHSEQDQKNRQWDDADLEIDNRPPAFGPEAFGGALRRGRRGGALCRGRYGLNVLHLTSSQLLLLFRLAYGQSPCRQIGRRWRARPRPQRRLPRPSAGRAHRAAPLRARTR